MGSKRQLVESSSSEESDVSDPKRMKLGEGSSKESVKIRSKKSVKKRSKIKVKSFKKEWLENCIEGSKVSMWLTPNSKFPGNFFCSVCPGYTHQEGWASIKQHGKGKLHKRNLELSQTNPEFKQANISTTPSASKCLEMMQEAEKRQSMGKEEALVAQVHYSFAMMAHGASGVLVDCQSDLIPKLFSRDSRVKVWDIKRTKFGYIGTHGLLPYLHNNMVKAMVARPFSIDFDESTVNGKSLLVVDSCYVNEQCLVEKRMYTCMEMVEGTSGLEVADTVCTSLERDGVDLQMLVVPASDGCSTILGKVKGAITILRQ